MVKERPQSNWQGILEALQSPQSALVIKAYGPTERSSQKKNNRIQPRIKESMHLYQEDSKVETPYFKVLRSHIAIGICMAYL